MTTLLSKSIKPIIITLLLTGFVQLNLMCNAVYYARHMSRGQGQYPEAIMLIDYLYWVRNPEIEGIVYDMDGTMTVQNLDGSVYCGNIYTEEVQYTYLGQEDIAYRFNRRFDLVHVTDMKK